MLKRIEGKKPSTEKEVLLKIANLKEAKIKGRIYQDVAEEWKEHHYPKLSPSTHRCYDAPFKRSLSEFGRERIRELKPSDIQGYINELAGKSYSYKTVKTHLQVMSLVYDYAIVHDEAESNPCVHVKIPKNLPKKKRALPSKSETELVKQGLGFHFGLFAYFLLYTGCRRGEAMALTWEDIDFEQNSISVDKSVVYVHNKPLCKGTKTAAGKRSIFLMQKLKDVLLPLRGSGLLFHSKGTHLSEATFKRWWAKYCAESGVTITPHQLRHAFATICFEAGLDEKDAQELLGHADITTTRNIYTHISEDRRQKTAKLLNEYDG